MKELDYQRKAIAEITDKTIKALNSGEKRRKIVFDAPTGAGKTVMAFQALAAIIDELRSRSDCRYQECAFIWLAPGLLHLQSYESLRKAFAETRKLRAVVFDELEQSEGIRPGEILFLNWESINKAKNRIISGGESSAPLSEIVRRTREDFQTPIVAIIDEEHRFWTATAGKSSKVLDVINPDVELRISASPKTLPLGPTEKVHVDRKDVIEAGMIKKEVVLNPDIDVDAPNPLSIEERLLRTALRKRRQIADEYERMGLDINPLLLVQLPNDSDRMTDEDLKVAEIVKTYLRINPQEEITTANGKLAVWLANEKANVEGLERPDSPVKVLLFKEAIALGWDCPRAAVLLIFRKLQSHEFTIQTVGRILRMPQQKHYPDDLLNIGYVYTDIAKDKIKIISDGYISKDAICATRRENLRNVDLPAVYSMRPNSTHNYLGPDFKAVLYEEAEKLLGLKGCPGILHFGEDGAPELTPEEEARLLAENRQRAQRLIALEVNDIDVKVPKDVHFQNVEQTLEVEQVKFARTPAEIDRVFMAYISGKGGQFETRQGDRTKRIAAYLLGVLEDYLEIFDTDAKKVVLDEDNRPVFDRLLDLALERYLLIRQAAKPDPRRLLVDFVWEVPPERVYNGENHEARPDILNHALDPFVEFNGSSSPEKRFVAFLERHSDSIDWWYKNGDKGMTHYAIPYIGPQGEGEPLFYPDFVIRMKSGRIYIFDTKTPGSDPKAPAKNNALLAYAQAERAKGKDLYGAVIIETTPDCWLHPTHEITDTTTLTHWTMFLPAKTVPAN